MRTAAEVREGKRAKEDALLLALRMEEETGNQELNSLERAEGQDLDCPLEPSLGHCQPSPWFQVS